MTTVLLLSGSTCNGETDKVTVNVGTAKQIASPGWGEVTSAAIPPELNSKCKDGRLFFAAGRNILWTDLKGNVQGTYVFPTPYTTVAPEPIADNHLVATKTGTLVHTFEGVIWEPTITPKPDWWDLTAKYRRKAKREPGGRGNIWVYQSKDCGASWVNVSNIDTGTLEVGGKPGRCAYPVLVPDDDKAFYSPQYPIRAGGGWDQHYLHGDPYHGDIYLTSMCLYGEPLAPGATSNATHLDGVILRSRDEGASWQVACHRPDFPGAFARIPVTVTAANQVAYLNITDDRKLRLSHFHANEPCDSAGANDRVIATIAADNRNATELSNIKIQAGWARIGLAFSYGANVLAAAYDYIEGGSRLGANVAKQFADGSFEPTNIGVVAGEGNAHMYHHGLIEGPPESKAVVLYFLEAFPTSPTGFQIGFRVYHDAVDVTGSVRTASKKWTYSPAFVGDYMSGASYKCQETETVFVLPWSQNGALWVNTVSVTVGDTTAEAKCRLAGKIESLKGLIGGVVKADSLSEGAPPGGWDLIRLGDHLNNRRAVRRPVDPVR